MGGVTRAKVLGVDIDGCPGSEIAWMCVSVDAGELKMTDGMKLIVTSNTWTRQVAECQQEDREWLAGNTVHVLEDASCWQL
eukprot:9375219-Prorocentrum_lima.AAC.1